MQNCRWRIKPGDQDRFWKLPLRLKTHWHWCWDQFDCVIILLRTLHDLRMKNRNPHKNCNDNCLRSIAEHKLRQRHIPLRQGREQVRFGRRESHSKFRSVVFVQGSKHRRQAKSSLSFSNLGNRGAKSLNRVYYSWAFNARRRPFTGSRVNDKPIEISVLHILCGISGLACGRSCKKATL